MISLGFVIGLIVATLFVAIGAGVTWWGLHRRAHPGDSYDIPWGFWFALGTVVIVLSLGITAIAMFPYDMQYHRFKPVTGTVAEVGTRLLSSDNGSTRFYAVRLTDNPTTYRCDDTRCSLLKPGTTLKLWCIREWEYASESGWVCRYGQAG